ncbi:MAG TPA: hypothetical protein VKE22_28830 [Haliangiales bacterium]|nr:hypothetical protein [Haliangiales bacterium]
MKRLVMVLGIATFLPAFAAADERGTYVTMDRIGTDSDVGIDVAALLYNSGGPDFGLRENVHARYVDPSGFGVFGQFSIGHVFGNGQSETAATNPEIGGLYILKLEGADVGFRFGLGFPTAPKTLNGAVTNVLTSIVRLEDVALIGPDALWLRPGVTVRAGSREVFAQLDLGIDIPLKTGDAGTKKVQLHGNVGVGTRQGPVALTAELATYGVDNNGLEFLHNLGASLRYVDGNVHPFISYVLPFKFGDKIPAHAIVAGVDGTF